MLLLAAATQQAAAFDFEFPDLLNGSGVAVSEVTAMSKGGKECAVAADQKFAIAPSPESSASAPKYLLTPIKDKVKGTTCDLNVAMQVSAQAVDSKTRYYEWTIGAAVIPFKYYKSGDKGVTGNTSALGYMGYKWHRPGGDLIFGFGAGPATISVPDGQGQDIQATGFSRAFMVLGQLGYNSTAQFGLAVGKDRVSQNLNWVNSGKTWIGVQIGAKIY
jgi:hypothetical protein